MSPRRAAIRPSEVLGTPACMCATGGECTVFEPGHALHLIQSRLASATPSEWTDAVVERVDAGSGDLVLRTLDGDVVALWHRGAARGIAAGTPVAVHRRYHVLALGRHWFNAAVA